MVLRRRGDRLEGAVVWPLFFIKSKEEEEKGKKKRRKRKRDSKALSSLAIEDSSGMQGWPIDRVEAKHKTERKTRDPHAISVPAWEIKEAERYESRGTWQSGKFVPQSKPSTIRKCEMDEAFDHCR